MKVYMCCECGSCCILIAEDFTPDDLNKLCGGEAKFKEWGYHERMGSKV